MLLHPSTPPFHPLDADALKQRLPLLDYLRQCNWTARRVGTRPEFLGLCPLHPETKPSFYVNARKNLFFCHGCGRGGDLIRLVELTHGLPFRQAITYLQQHLVPPTHHDVLEQTLAFYQLQLHQHPEAVHYLTQRGLHDPALIAELGIGYAPGGNLRRHLAAQGYTFHELLDLGLINSQGRDAFCRRIIFPCRHQGRIANLYGRSIGSAFPHRFLPRSKGELFAWESVRQARSVILVEGLFDLAVLWQAGFRNTTCPFGAHLTPAQLQQLIQRPQSRVYIVFDQDENHAGQQASRHLAEQLESAGITARIVHLPKGHDPNSYFLAGATAADFQARLAQAQPR
jgi:DNA primase